LSLADRIAANPAMLLDRTQVEAVFGLSRRWLELAAHKGHGPAMVRISRRMVRYRASDVQAWLDARRENPEATA
jgi:predicted DNA-binding transcriptional regulator AlpA